MNKEQIKEILDNTNINVLDEINIIETIDELKNNWQLEIKEKLQLQYRLDKAIEYCGNTTRLDAGKIMNILRGNDEKTTL